MTPDYIIQLRKQKKWSQQKLADLIGVSKTTVWKIENGRTAIDKKTELAIGALSMGFYSWPPENILTG